MTTPRTQQGSRPPFRRGGRRRRQCFCKENTVDYKDVSSIRRFITDRGRIEAGKKSGNCAKCQRNLTTAIKRARHRALLPFAPDHLRVTGSVASRSKISEDQDEKLEDGENAECSKHPCNRPCFPCRNTGGGGGHRVGTEGVSPGWFGGMSLFTSRNGLWNRTENTGQIPRGNCYQGSSSTSSDGLLVAGASEAGAPDGPGEYDWAPGGASVLADSPPGESRKTTLNARTSSDVRASPELLVYCRVDNRPSTNTRRPFARY